MAVLEAKNLGIAFGGLRALQDVQFSIGEKEIIGLIGPNGAGKTTVFNLLTGCVCSHGGDHHPRKPEHCWEKDVPDHAGGNLPHIPKYPFV